MKKNISNNLENAYTIQKKNEISSEKSKTTFHENVNENENENEHNIYKMTVTFFDYENIKKKYKKKK